MTKSALVESLANRTLDNDEKRTEDEVSEEELDENELEGYVTTDQRIHPEIVEAIHSADRSTRLEATIKIRRLLECQRWEPHEVVQPVIDSGLLPEIVKMLSLDDLDFLWESTCIVVNITAGSTKQIFTVVETGVVPKLVTLFPISPDNVRVNILITVGNLLGDSKQLRFVTIRDGGFKLALDVLRDPGDHSEKCVESAAWAVGSATTLQYDRFPDAELAAQTITVLTTFIRQNDDGISESLTEAVIALQQLSHQCDVTAAILKGGITRQIVQLCTAKDTRLREHVLRLIIHMSRGGDDSVQEMMDANCLEVLDSCIAEYSLSRRTAYSAVAELARGPSSLVRALAESPLLSRILHILSQSEENLALKREAANVPLNMTRTATSQIELLDPMIKAGYLEAVSQGLLSDESCMVAIQLEMMEQILGAKWDGRQRALERFKALDGPRRLRDVMMRRSPRKTEAVKVARKILEAHFPEYSKWPRV
ncbi:Importin alpha subunit (Karyopherin alpha subunit) (Serine-rich RNA polymerase I suppressor protein) [Tulasnella sp. 408]|nr:Importin alpha subunit (Karyopherin alpha subunit) (Serine-rich RNA polymerase I suppressor protein) [Tulasnella sp. 408]